MELEVKDPDLYNVERASYQEFQAASLEMSSVEGNRWWGGGRQCAPLPHKMVIVIRSSSPATRHRSIPVDISWRRDRVAGRLSRELLARAEEDGGCLVGTFVVESWEGGCRMAGS